MVKQITAILLVLAIANPFCCCFGSLLKLGADDDAVSKSVPVNSCCHCNPEPTEGEGDLPSDDESPSKGCACKQVYTLADAKQSILVSDYKWGNDLFDVENRDFVTSLSAIEIFSRGVTWRPPPPRRTNYQTLYCSYLI